MAVAPDDQWHFAHALPKIKDEEETHIVAPSALQMGWSESPPFFCSATETARDVAHANMEKPTGSMPQHHLEDKTTALARQREGMLKHLQKAYEMTNMDDDEFRKGIKRAMGIIRAYAGEGEENGH